MRLGVNIDHVATLRQARRGRYPDPVAAAAVAELGGADQITLHVREDRRHVNDRDLSLLRQTVNGTLNLEMAAVQPIARIDEITELNIGYSIVCRAVLVGLERAVRDMKELIVRPGRA